MTNLSKTALELAQKISHLIWEKYEDTHGYKTEKQTRNANVSTDHPDNIWFFWGQFDQFNQSEFMYRVRGAVDKKVDGAQELLDFLESQVQINNE